MAEFLVLLAVPAVCGGAVGLTLGLTRAAGRSALFLQLPACAACIVLLGVAALSSDAQAGVGILLAIIGLITSLCFSLCLVIGLVLSSPTSKGKS